MPEGRRSDLLCDCQTVLMLRRTRHKLELFKKKGIEVLLMADRVDEWAMEIVHEFDERTPIRNVAKR